MSDHRQVARDWLAEELVRPGQRSAGLDILPDFAPESRNHRLHGPPLVVVLVGRSGAC